MKSLQEHCLIHHPPHTPFLSCLYLNHITCNLFAFDLIGFAFEWELIINTKPLSDANIFSIALLNLLNNLKGTEDSLMLIGEAKTIPIGWGQGMWGFPFLFLLNAFLLYSWKGHSYRTLKAK